MNEEILFNQLYERTKEFGRTQFVREIMRLERENKHLQQERDKYKSIIDEARKFIKEKYEEDYSKNDNYNPIERLNLKNCSYERSLQVLEILNKVGDVK